MSGDKIRRGLEQTLAFVEGRGTAKVRRISLPYPVDVKSVRAKLGMTQAAFAERFGFSLSAVRHWEQGKRIPEASARMLLTLVERDPNYVEQSLAAAERARIAAE